MIKVDLFAEDQGHVRIVGELIRAVAGRLGTPIHLVTRTTRGGYGRVIGSVRQYAREINATLQPMPDVLVVATDANCKGANARVKAVRDVVGDLTDRLVCAIPDPHVERWLLVDAHAFKAVLGKGCSAPDHKCERDRYKELLARAVESAGPRPPLGGIEYAADLITAMNLTDVRQNDASLGRFLDELEARLRQLRSPEPQ